MGTLLSTFLNGLEEGAAATYFKISLMLSLYFERQSVA